MESACMYSIIGGFHLIDVTTDRIERTVEELKKIGLSVIAPMHCTVFKASMKIAEALPEAFKKFHCGDR
jgi:7,8-dihydropterin-6-yl-methyl-4-(beta-D-ribofuranosyl)aminobenzene 5'-phosphate synthase